MQYAYPRVGPSLNTWPRWARHAHRHFHPLMNHDRWSRAGHCAPSRLPERAIRCRFELGFRSEKIRAAADALVDAPVLVEAYLPLNAGSVPFFLVILNLRRKKLFPFVVGFTTRPLPPLCLFGDHRPGSCPLRHGCLLPEKSPAILALHGRQQAQEPTMNDCRCHTHPSAGSGHRSRSATTTRYMVLSTLGWKRQGKYRTTIIRFFERTVNEEKRPMPDGASA